MKKRDNLARKQALRTDGGHGVLPKHVVINYR
jgi:hypothetical protein